VGSAGPDIAGTTARAIGTTMTRHGRQWRRALLGAALATAAACASDAKITDPSSGSPPPPPPAKVLLKDVLVEHLPSPFYHFDYDAAGTITGVSYASGLFDYDVGYLADGRIGELRNGVLVGTGRVTRDRIVYAYDAEGRVSGARYVDASGTTYTVVVYTYDGPRLTGVERDRRLGNALVLEKTISLAYHPDGNLRELVEHRPAIADLQTEYTSVVDYDQYDTGINVDGFGLVHDDFFDQFVLLPGVQIQKNNPGRETRTGDGLQYTMNWTYDYDDARRPVAKAGDMTITSGTDAGRWLLLRTTFTYY
jgi:hypothetical protein